MTGSSMEEEDIEDQQQDELCNFVELESLEKTEEGYYEWRERARWYKLEEDVEEGSERWSKPFVPSISYNALAELKACLEEGQVLLDVEETSLQGIADRIVDAVESVKAVSPKYRSVLRATILARHHHQHQKDVIVNKFALSTPNSATVSPEQPGVFIVLPRERTKSEAKRDIEAGHRGSRAFSTRSFTSPVAFLSDEDNGQPNRHQHSDMHDIILEGGGETTTVLVAKLPYVKIPVAIFIRLRLSVILGNLTEAPLPVRYVCLIMGPDNCQMSLYQVGRAAGTLMSDLIFSDLAAQAQVKEDLLSGVEQFLSKTVILPPGNWDKNLLRRSVTRIEYNTNAKASKRRKSTVRLPDSIKDHFKKKQKSKEEDPLEKTGRPFGGLVNDFKRKIQHYGSDFVDAIHIRCLIAIVFIYFSFLAPAITFGVLLSNVTDGMMGVSESIIATAFSGIIFGFFSGQPLIVLGATGPMLVMEESIYQLSELIGAEFLTWRVWIGFWITLFCILIVAFDLTHLVRYFTLFTEEIIAALVSIIFIYESFKYLVKMFIDDPVTSVQINVIYRNSTNMTSNTTIASINSEKTYGKKALMTLILMLSTFLISFYSRKIRHSQYFPLKFRRLLSDFGILMAVIIVYLFDYVASDDFMPKLDIPDGFLPTRGSKRHWAVPVTGDKKDFSIWLGLFAAVPAFLVTIILFMETLLTGIVVNKKEHKLKKGAGYSLDILMVGILATISSVIGLPWMCACPVHSISHLNSLTILSTKHVPGTKPYVTRVIEQRVTNIIMHLLIGLSVFLAPMLREIPVAVAFGVFLYLGVTSLSHLQLLQRVKLLFVPPKHHPDRRYIRKVKTKKIHLYTLIQLTCLIIVAVVKSSLLAPGFPFLILLILPLRGIGLKKLFAEDELTELDTEHENAIENDLDEYQEVHVPI